MIPWVRDVPASRVLCAQWTASPAVSVARDGLQRSAAGEGDLRTSASSATPGSTGRPKHAPMRALRALDPTGRPHSSSDQARADARPSPTSREETRQSGGAPRLSFSVREARLALACARPGTSMSTGTAARRLTPGPRSPHLRARWTLDGGSGAHWACRHAIRDKHGKYVRLRVSWPRHAGLGEFGARLCLRRQRWRVRSSAAMPSALR
jgi:hypothetical protein